jgi:uncharacterized GH25 family protein
VVDLYRNGGGIVKSKLLIAVWGILLLPAGARGEDSWLIADSHAVNTGEPLWLSFVTGHVFPFGDAPSDPADVTGFVDRCGSDIRTVAGYARQDRGLSIREPITGEGIHVIGCTLAREIVEIPKEDFDSYLRRERADQALAIQNQRAGSRAMVCEAYTKFAKTIVEVYPADRDDVRYQVPLGHRLEIIPLSNPCRWQDGATVDVEVRLDGYPWPDVAVSAGHDGAKDRTYAAETKTDSSGVARIQLTKPGHWFIKAHLIRPTDQIGRAEWESFWASLTFRVAGPADVNEVLRMARAVQRTVQPWIVAGYQVAQRALGQAARDVFVMTPVAPSGTPPVASLSEAPAHPAASAASVSPLASR